MVSSQIIGWYPRILLRQYEKLKVELNSQAQCAKCGGKCCRTCAPFNGYLNEELHPETINLLKKRFGWSSEKGFQSDTGCRLPTELRSPTCLFYFCYPKSADESQMSFEEKMQISSRINEAAKVARSCFSLQVFDRRAGWVK